MPITITDELARVDQLYKESSAQKKLGCLLLGDVGVGKTTALTTARKPILVHSFDPSGAQSIKHLVGSDHGVFVDTFYEGEDRSNPTAYNAWRDKARELEQAGVFNAMGTYCIDSYTFFYPAVMNQVIKQTTIKRNYGLPERTDYRLAGIAIQDMIKSCMQLPCDFILTGHLSPVIDEATGRTFLSMHVTPMLRVDVPALFSEIYILHARLTGPNKIERSLQTTYDGVAIAKTRLGANDKLGLREPVDFKALLAKAGLSTEDKPWKT